MRRLVALATVVLSSCAGVAASESSRSPTGVRQQSAEGNYSARVTADGNMYYSIAVVRIADDSLLQTISLRNGIDPSEPGGVRFVDADRDGHEDLVVLGGSSDGGDWYKVWRFAAESGEFVWSRTTELGEEL